MARAGRIVRRGNAATINDDLSTGTADTVLCDAATGYRMAWCYSNDLAVGVIDRFEAVCRGYFDVIDTCPFLNVTSAARDWVRNHFFDCCLDDVRHRTGA